MALWSFQADRKLGILKVEEGLTVSHVGAVRDSLLKAFSEADRVVVDVAAVRDVDVAGLQLLCSAHRLAATQGKVLSFEGAGEPLRILAHAIGFDRGTLCPGEGDPLCFWSEMA